MTQDQINSLARQFLMIVGGAIGSYFTQKGILSQDQATFLGTQAPALIGIVMALGGAAWATIAHKQVNMIATVAVMPKVNHVETNDPGLAEAANAAAGPLGTVVAK